jgi:hypothetical protein
MPFGPAGFHNVHACSQARPDLRRPGQPSVAHRPSTITSVGTDFAPEPGTSATEVTDGSLHRMERGWARASMNWDATADPLRSTAPHSGNIDRQGLPLVDDMHGEQLERLVADHLVAGMGHFADVDAASRGPRSHGLTELSHFGVSRRAPATPPTGRRLCPLCTLPKKRQVLPK